MGGRRPEPLLASDASAARHRRVDAGVRDRHERLHRLSPDGTLGNNPGDPVRVRIEKDFTLIPILGIGTITIRGSSTQRVERFADDGTYPPSSYVDVTADIGTCTP